jgi:DNA-binding NarL/FixJ family response regulator
MQNVNLIIADDHQIIIDGIEYMLSKEKNITIVYKANNTSDVLNFLQKKSTSINFLITDINMPSISGIELCRIVKQNYLHIKVLFLSMYSSKEMIKEAMLAEADGYMLKNGGKDKLIEAIQKINCDNTYYSEEIIPVIYSQFQKEKIQQEKLSLLSDREKDILILIAKEFSSEEIAQKLFLSVKTIGYHRQNLLQKCDCKSSVGLVKYAIKAGLVEA